VSLCLPTYHVAKRKHAFTAMYILVKETRVGLFERIVNFIV
jgi:hypothetical protein